jgi:uncharacterized protein (TIGR00299 family) protein
MRGGAYRPNAAERFMTRVAWFNCAAGVAGDMLLAALVDAGADPIRIGEMLGGLGVDHYALTFERTQRAGVRATRALVATDDHAHHRAWRDIRTLIEAADLPDRVRTDSLKVFGELAAVEAKIHGVAVDDVEFHEVGAIDSIVDIVGICAALHDLGIERIVCGPIGTGHGTVHTQHGVVPNPSPAVIELSALRQVRLIGLDDHRELATPTGVAAMVALADTFGPLPEMEIAARGFGAGSLDINGRANVVQVVIGEAERSPITVGQMARLFEANVDDVTGEVIAHTIASLLEAGAFDAWATPIMMKKGRPAFTVHVLCDPASGDEITRVLIRETGTLGVRGTFVERWPQRRSESVVVIEGHEIRVKIADGRVKVEHDDAVRAAVALELPLREVLMRAEAAAN